jgi:anti-sigma B factor antagonist
MQITVKAKGGITVLRISGNMVFDVSLFQMRGHVQEALGLGMRRFIIDISEVPFMDSSPIGELITIYTSVSRAQGSLIIVKPAERVRVLFDRIRLTGIFKFADSLDAAETALVKHLRHVATGGPPTTLFNNWRISNECREFSLRCCGITLNRRARR